MWGPSRLLELADRYQGTDLGAVAQACVMGEPAADLAVYDLLEERGASMQPPFEVGKSYIICTVTLYYVGRVDQVSFGFIRLQQASWVHWTGRLSELLKYQRFPRQGRRARVEPCGEVLVATGAIVAAYPWTGELPKEPIE